MVTIGIDQSLSNSALYKHRCLENIKKLYKSAGKWDDQYKYRDIIESEMISTTEGFTENSLISPGPSITAKKI